MEISRIKLCFTIFFPSAVYTVIIPNLAIFTKKYFPLTLTHTWEKRKHSRRKINGFNAENVLSKEFRPKENMTPMGVIYAFEWIFR